MSAETTRRYAGWLGVPARPSEVCSAAGSGPPPRASEGQIGVLALGLFVLATLLVLGAIDVTAAQLARMRLLDAADSAALDAADALDERAAYEGGVLDHLALTDESVAGAASAHLARTPMPSGNHVVVRRPRHGHDGRRDRRRHDPGHRDPADERLGARVARRQRHHHRDVARSSSSRVEPEPAVPTGSGPRPLPDVRGAPRCCRRLFDRGC